MAEETPAAGAQAQPLPPRMQVRTQYIKDMSFENVIGQKYKTPKGAPDVKVGVNLDGKKLDDGTFEVVMHIEVKATASDEPLFLLEMDYAGLFTIENVPNEQLHPYLMIECPRMLFPYVRRIVSDVTRDGGFPPVNVDNIDFLQLYRNEIARRQAAPTEGTA